jgi:hypothetical protein
MTSASLKFDLEIAMFSIVGLSTSMVMVFVGGFEIAYPWF